jgi:hypothetical protein
MPVGPELPPHLMKRKRSIDDESESSSPPAKIQAAAVEEPSKPRRVLGPAPPPAALDELPLQPVSNAEDDSSSDDDDYGPSLPPAPGTAAAYKAEAETYAREEAEAERDQIKKPQREEWMLVPPTETPEQKRQRLEDEVMGRKDLSTSSVKPSGPRKDEAEAVATARRIKDYNDKNRAKSLYDEHKKATPKEKEDDPSKRSFDKEKDMGLGGRIGHVQKQDMLKRAGDFGSRFERGSYL